MIVTSRDTLAIARVTARKGRTADLTRTVRERYGIDLPVGPRRAQSGDMAFIGIGVNTWLATSEKELDGFAASLRSVVDESATVSDQIGAYQVLRLTGPAREGCLGEAHLDRPASQRFHCRLRGLDLRLAHPVDALVPL